MSAAGLAQRSLRNTVLTRSVAISSCRGAAAAAAAKMTSESSSRDPGANPKVVKVRELIGSSGPTGGWEKCWEEGVTPWDLGKPTPVVQHLLETGNLPKGRVLIPGCGTGYDVVAIASPERYVVGLEISTSAIKKATEWSSSLPNANYFSFLLADFFTWQPTELFDLVFDYTFFCAIDPCMRPAWAQKIRDILKPDGELITLMFPIGDHAGGPPYNVSVAAYREVLIPLGFKALSIVDNELAIEARKVCEDNESRETEVEEAPLYAANFGGPSRGGRQRRSEWRWSRAYEDFGSDRHPPPLKMPRPPTPTFIYVGTPRHILHPPPPPPMTTSSSAREASEAARDEAPLMDPQDDFSL